MNCMYKQKFIQKVEALHGIEHYDFSEVPEIVKGKEYVKIRCIIHNIVFEVNVRKFISSIFCECPECIIEKNTEDFIRKAKLVHGDKYDYSKVRYIKSKEKIIIICPIHGEFTQTPNQHLNGNGCPVCGGRVLYTKEKFIDEANKIHNFKFDYSLVDFVNMNTKVKIICPIHGVFEQTPSSHLKYKGCPYCSHRVPYTKEKFIDEANKIHNFKFDYSLVDFVNMLTKVKIICPIHGIFEQLPQSHIAGQGCPYCAGKAKVTKEIFVERSNKIHNFKYNYDLIDSFKNIFTKVKIICPIHGVFEQTPHSHMNGQGCPYCAGTTKITKEMFIERSNKIHNFKYNYDLIDSIKNTHTKVKIICPIHGVFEQTPKEHMKGSGCPYCSHNVRKTTEQFIDEANIVHNFKYDYSKVEYENETTKVIIICPEHGEFLQTPKNHLLGNGCPQCYDLHNSKLEQHVEQFLKDNKIDFIRQQKFDWLKDKGYLKLDFYLPKYNIAIECQGSQHFHKHCIWGNKLDDVQRRDDIKYNQCKEHRIDILYFAFNNYDKNYRLGKIYTNLKKLLKKILEYDTTNGTQ